MQSGKGLLPVLQARSKSSAKLPFVARPIVKGRGLLGRRNFQKRNHFGSACYKWNGWTIFPYFFVEFWPPNCENEAPL
jgi:hypothetical protein